MKYQIRFAQNKIKQLAKSYPVIVISGPRQSGKSTLAQKTFSKHLYVSLEDLDLRQFAKNDPRGFLDQFAEKKVIIDEIQNVPSLFSYIQGIVDKNKIKAQFVLTGSSQLKLLERVSQSLAGRASIFQLLPLELDEINEKMRPKKIEEAIFKGSYPNIYFDKMPPTDWYQDYIANYIERDVRNLLNVKDLGTFQIFLKMCAARCGQVANYSSFAVDCGISPNTAKEWMNILEASFITYRLNPYYRNYSKRLIKSPKLYFFDTGVACSLLNIRKSQELVSHSLRGGLFENWVISELYKNFSNHHLNPDFYFWRDNKGVEVDLIIDHGENFSALELKSGKTIDNSFFKNLQYIETLASSQKNLKNKYLIYGGELKQTRNNSLVLPWKKLKNIKTS